MVAHTDLEIVTLLLHDEAGGLELKNTDGEWAKAILVSGVPCLSSKGLTAVCDGENAGDLFMRLSN